MNEILKWVLGFLGAIILGLSTWMLTNILDIKRETLLHGFKIDGIEKSVGEISVSMKTFKIGPTQQLDPNELANQIYLKMMKLDEEIQRK